MNQVSRAARDAAQIRTVHRSTAFTCCLAREFEVACSSDFRSASATVLRSEDDRFPTKATGTKTACDSGRQVLGLRLGDARSHLRDSRPQRIQGASPEELTGARLRISARRATSGATRVRSLIGTRKSVENAFIGTTKNDKTQNRLYQRRFGRDRSGELWLPLPGGIMNGQVEQGVAADDCHSDLPRPCRKHSGDVRKVRKRRITNTNEFHWDDCNQRGAIGVSSVETFVHLLRDLTCTPVRR